MCITDGLSSGNHMNFELKSHHYQLDLLTLFQNHLEMKSFHTSSLHRYD